MSRATSPGRRVVAPPDQAHPVDADSPGTSPLADLGLPVGMSVRCVGERGVFTVHALREDGSVTCIAQANGHFRSFRPEWLYAAYRRNRSGRLVPTKRPQDKHDLREQWRIANGFEPPRPRA